MANMEKMSSGNTDTAIVRNCDLDSNYIWHVFKVLCSVPMYKSINVLHSIMETILILLWISKYQKGFLNGVDWEW